MRSILFHGYKNLPTLKIKRSTVHEMPFLVLGNCLEIDALNPGKINVKAVTCRSISNLMVVSLSRDLLDSVDLNPFGD